MSIVGLARGTPHTRSINAPLSRTVSAAGERASRAKNLSITYACRMSLKLNSESMATLRNRASTDATMFRGAVTSHSRGTGL